MVDTSSKFRTSRCGFPMRWSTRSVMARAEICYTLWTNFHIRYIIMATEVVAVCAVIGWVVVRRCLCARRLDFLQTAV